MERFQLAESEEERIEKYEQVKRQTGFEDWQISAYDEWFGRHSEFNYVFGLENTFPQLDEQEEKAIDELFFKRDELLEEQEKILDQLKPLLDAKAKLEKILKTINSQICQIEGHRLSEQMEPIIDDDDYGSTQLIGYSRTCLICGAKINKSTIKPKDVVVKAEPTQQKKKIKTNNKQ